MMLMTFVDVDYFDDLWMILMMLMILSVLMIVMTLMIQDYFG